MSTNNGDDNQLFAEVLENVGGDFWTALDTVVKLAPNGAKAYQEQAFGHAAEDYSDNSSVSNIVNGIMDEATS
ncbi:MAG: hypothetical protein R3A13_02150 [Bdellovibrionota bacterium]